MSAVVCQTVFPTVSIRKIEQESYAVAK